MAWKLGISTKSGTEAAIDVCDYFTNEENSGSVSGITEYFPTLLVYRIKCCESSNL